MSGQVPVRLGIDTGGTFTDFVCYADNRLSVHKVLSTPSAPERAILQGIRELGLEGRAFYLVHGTTVATNAVLEGKGVRTAYVTNRGLADVLSIGRQVRPELYNLQPQAVPEPVPASLCLEVGGRLAADGSVVEPLDEEELGRLIEELTVLDVEAVAINLLFSYIDDRFERRIAEALPGKLFISRSSYILPEQGEYERGIATWLNAWIGPRVKGYLQRLKRAVAPSPVHVMQSSGLTIDADQAAQRAVNLLLSGPAGGLMGALLMGGLVGRTRLLTFDMGGTSTDVALIDGELSLTSEGRIGRYPVAVPMVDMHTIGAGGGSIAYVDDGGMLAVGPASAGADPGPACYARGGKRPTVTDANLVLGRLPPSALLGGTLKLDALAAHRVLAELGDSMGLSAEQAALGVVELANAHMAQALRVISVERGTDPGNFTLTAFGGAGGLHVCALCDALSVTRALVPVYAGVLSALGMLSASRGRQLTHTLCAPLQGQTDNGLYAQLQQLVEQGRDELLAEGVDQQFVEARFSLDLRYQGQGFTLNVAYRDVAQAEQAFHRAHRQRFGHALDIPVELVNLRVALSTPAGALPLEQSAGDASGIARDFVSVVGESRPVPVWRRGDLCADAVLPGPAIVSDRVATCYIARGWQCSLHASGCLLLDRTDK